MADDTGKLVRWLVGLSEFESDVVPCAGIKHQEADTLSHFKTNDKDKAPLGDEVPVFTILHEIFTCRPKTETTDIQFTKPPKVPFVRIIPNICMFACIRVNDKAKILKVAKFTSVSSTEADCRSSLAYIVKQNTRFNLNSDEVLFVAFVLDSALLRVVTAPLRTRFLHISHFCLLAGTLTSFKRTAP